MFGNMSSMVMALFMAKFMLNDIPHMLDYYEQRQDIVDQYGSWSVGRAESVCARGDAECVRREAARLQGTQLVRITY